MGRVKSRPFDNPGGKGFDAVYPPEQKIDLAAEYDGKTGKVRWRDYVTTHQYGKVDMNQPYGKLKEVTAYAATDFFSDQAQAVELRLGGKNSWLAVVIGASFCASVVKIPVRGVHHRDTAQRSCDQIVSASPTALLVARSALISTVALAR